MILGLKPRSTAAAEINAETAYNLWRTLTDRSINHGLFIALKNFVHDRDLYNYLDRLNKEFESEINILRTKMDRFSIVGPQFSPRDENIQADTEAFTDLLICQTVYRLLRLDVSLLLLSIKYVPINDDTHEYLVTLIKDSINRVDRHIIFAKSKNWIYPPPEYPDVPDNVKQKLATNEAHLLWDHLNFRYNNVRTTQLYAAYAIDTDFKVLLELGVKILNSQIKTLEEKLLYFGIPLPRPFTDAIPQPGVFKEFVQDRYLFNNLLRGIQDAVAVHGTAIQEVILSDGLRKYFIELTLEEISYMEKMAKYGKVRGWAMMPPPYKAK